MDGRRTKNPPKRASQILLFMNCMCAICPTDPNSGIKQKGKFLGLDRKPVAKAAMELSTGLDHIKSLGVTHIHLLPSFDFNSVDETKPNGKYNWGYDPLNYNVPEGGYSTNPYDGNVRIHEFKKMVQTLHANGLRVILDVVYNHTIGYSFVQFQPVCAGLFLPAYRNRRLFWNGTGLW